VSTDDESVEQWARSHHFSEPLRLAEVEAGVLAREPVAAPGLPLWIHAIGAVGWIFMGIAFLLGAGASLLGLLAAWLAVRDAPGDSGSWMGVAQLVYVCSAFAYAFYLVEVVRATRRQVVDMVSAVVTVVASAATFMVLRSSPGTVPDLVSLAVVVTGVLGALVLVASIMSRTPRPTDDTRKPPLRGPSRKADRENYLHTRELALDIVVDRGLVKLDDLEKSRINRIPLGYWEELDGVDERERRRILEYAVIGWRTFSDHDRRAWSPPGLRKVDG
jgi:hypothetical protein